MNSVRTPWAATIGYLHPGFLPLARGLGRYMLVVVALHVPSWLLAWLTNGPWIEERPIFNVDLVFAALLACLNTTAGAVALFLAWAAEFIRTASKSFYFLSVLDFVDAARFADLLNLRLFFSLPLLVAMLGLAGCAWIVLKQTRRARGLALSLLLSLPVLAGLDMLNGSSRVFDSYGDRWLISKNLAGSPIWNIWHAQKRNPLASGRPSVFEGVKSYRALDDWHMTHPDGSSLLVLVESMGLPKSPLLQDWLVSRLSTPRLLARWTPEFSSEPFLGATTSGELRTLCGLKGHYSRLTEADAKACLPSRLQGMGVRAIGMHGFHLRMFDRQDWWPRIGLEPWRPKTAAGEASLQTNCNAAFPGVCDLSLLREAVRMADGPRRLVYALTLDTHLPLPPGESVVPAELARRCSLAQTPEAACSMVNRLSQVLGWLEDQLAQASNPSLVVIAGDHAPPFSSKENREAFDSGAVPIIMLKPKR